MKIKTASLSQTAEVLGVSVIALGFILYFYKLLFTGERMLTHDTAWFYGIFHYFAECLQNGFFPYWDPYDYCGQPFYNIISTMYIINPATIGIIFAGGLFNTDLFTLYHWHFIIKLLLVNIGVYLCFRQTTKSPLSRLLLLLVFSFSSFTFASLRPSGIVYTLSWLPWSLWFFMRFLNKRTLTNIVGFACFAGMSIIAYQGLLAAAFLILFIPSFLISDRAVFKEVLSSRRGVGLILVFILIIGAFSLQGISIYLDKDEFVPMARMKTSPDEDIRFDDAGGGKSSKPMDFLSLVNPRLAATGYFTKAGAISEGFLYIGIVPFILALVGLVFGKGRWKANFVYMIFILIFLMLGQMTGAQRLLNIIFPPFKFVRHTFLFAGFFIFCLMYFVGLGADLIFHKIRRRRPALVAVLAIPLIIVMELLAYASVTFDYVTMKRAGLSFDRFNTSEDLISGRRVDRVVESDLIRYYKPILYDQPSALNSCTITEHFDRGAVLTQGLYGAYKDSMSKRPSDFVDAGSKYALREMVHYGISKYDEWTPQDRRAFLELLYITVLDISVRSDFYSAFEGLGGLLAYIRSSILAGIKENMMGRDNWPGKEKTGELFTRLFDLGLQLRPGYQQQTFIWIRRPYSFRQMIMMHNRLFKDMAAKEYLAHTWASNHSEEFTIIQYKQYKELLDLLQEAKGDDKQQHLDALYRASGIDADIIRFFDSAQFARREDIKKSITENPGADLLYLESDAEAGEEAQDNPQVYTDTAQSGFAYEVVDYNPNLIKMQCQSQKDGYLYFSDGYDRYWQASVDGLPTKVYRANLAFKAVKIPSGDHRVEFRYNPAFFRLSIVVYYLAIAISGIIILLGRKRDI